MEFCNEVSCSTNVLRKLPYRTTSLALAMIFTLFSVGLPIVVAACPMTKGGMTTQICCDMGTSAKSQMISSMRNYSCCKTIVAAERNTTEFIGNQGLYGLVAKAAGMYSILIARPVLPSSTFVISSASPNGSPPSRGNILIFVSSLLI